MPDELTPHQPSSADPENLADSDDPEVLAARAKVLEAEAKLKKAQTPLLDKIVLRGLIPIALAIVGPWALWKFDKAQTEQQRQGEVIVQLQDLLKKAQDRDATRQTQSKAWRARMGKIEEERAAELASMTAMVVRLDNLLKLVLVRDAVSRASSPTKARAEVIRDVQEQLPDLHRADVERIAGQELDRLRRPK